MIPKAFIQDLLSRGDIVAVVGRQVELKKAGVNYKGLCPFHGEKTPSFTVSPSRQTYHCFGCGAHGNAVGFLMESAGLSFVDAVHELAQEFGLQVPQEERTPEQSAQAAKAREQELSLVELLRKASDHYRQQLKASPRAVEYLKHRGLTGTIAARFALGYAPDGWRGLASVFPAYDDPALVESGLVVLQEDTAEVKRYDRFRDRIMFPIRNVKGDIIGFGGRVLDKGEPKYLNSPETPVFVKGRELYGLYEGRTAFRQKGYALVVEGYMDVVALAQHGFENAVATLGTACTDEHVQKLFRFTDSVVFSFDGDNAGRRAARRALEAALPHASDTRSVKFLFLPAEHDPDSYIRELGEPAFERCLEEAVPLSKQLLIEAAESCDLGTLEGRSQMLATARPWWRALPDGALKRQLFNALAQHASLATHELEQLWPEWAPSKSAGAPSGAAGARPGDGFARSLERVRSPRGKRRREPPGFADHALKVLLERPVCWATLSPEDHLLLAELAEPHGSLFRWLEQQYTEHGDQPWSALREALRGEPFEALAVDLVEGSLPAEDSDDAVIQTELRIALEEMQLQTDRREADRLVALPQGQADYLAVFQRMKHRRQTLDELRRSLLPTDRLGTPQR